jgi:hypothetical protein
MFATYTTDTGALIAENLAEEPAPVEGVAVVRMPPSAIAGVTIWSAAARGYVDRPAPMPLLDYVRLWTMEERIAVRASNNAMLVDAYFLLLATPTVDLGNAEVIAGIDLAQSLNILTEARANRIKAGLPPL